MAARRQNTVGILEMPLEVKALILREVFRGATVELATPYSLPHIQQLVHTNKVLSVFAIENLGGDVAETVLLKEAVFKFLNLADFEGDDLRLIRQLQHIRYLTVKPAVYKFGASLRCLKFFPSLQEVTFTVASIPLTALGRRHTPSWLAYQFQANEKVELASVARVQREYKVFLDLEYSCKLEPTSEEQDLCKARVSGGKLLNLEVADKVSDWTEAIVDGLKLDKL